MSSTGKFRKMRDQVNGYPFGSFLCTLKGIKVNKNEQIKEQAKKKPRL
jgi:hypothetical protein